MSSNRVFHDYVAGGVGGAAGLFVGHPFDTTKVQMQTQKAHIPYKGTWDAMQNINKHGIVRGFFRGLAFPLASYGVVNSVFFGVYGNTQRVLRGSEDRTATHSEAFVAGCTAGFSQLFIACPVDVVKVVLQSQISRGGPPGNPGKWNYFRGPSECALWLHRQHGLKGFYHGFTAMALRDIPTFGVYTLVYELLFRRFTLMSFTDSEGIVASLLAGGFAGVACWTLAIPFDVVKSLLQADTKQNRFRGTWDCIGYVYKQHGLRGFFTGLQVTCIRAFPVNAVTFLFYSQSLKHLNKWGEQNVEVDIS